MPELNRVKDLIQLVRMPISDGRETLVSRAIARLLTDLQLSFISTQTARLLQETTSTQLQTSRERHGDGLDTYKDRTTTMDMPLRGFLRLCRVWSTP